MMFRNKPILVFVTISIFIHGIQSLQENQVDGSNREQKLLSPFTVIQFKNEGCSGVADSSFKGTCFTADECASHGGHTDGNCAAGFGVCCIFKIHTCDQATINRNCTYLQNPGYPSSYATTSTTCTYTVERFCEGICQLRYDFETLTVLQPDDMGLCSDTVVATTPTGPTLPTLCGALSGDHIYTETGSSGNLGTLSITHSADAGSRQWNIKVSAIPCNTNYLAPQDCLQYFDETSGTFNSFNHGQMIRNHQYKICFRQNEGMCGITYQVNGIVPPGAFELSPDGDSYATYANCVEGKTAYVTIPQSIDTVDPIYACGTFFCHLEAALNNCPISSTLPPFELGVWTKDDDLDEKDNGFTLDYTQSPC